MKKTRFLTNMKKEGKLEIIEPSEEVCRAYLEKANSNLESAKILASAGKTEEPISMAYCGMYNALLALLFKCGIKSENHAASIMLLKEVFRQKELEKEISFGKKERIDKQYYLDFAATEKDADEMIAKTGNFVSKIKVIIRTITNKEISEARKELEEALK